MWHTHTPKKKKAGHLTHNATLKTATMSQTLETKYNFTALTNTVNPKIATLFKTDCQASFKKRLRQQLLSRQWKKKQASYKCKYTGSRTTQAQKCTSETAACWKSAISNIWQLLAAIVLCLTLTCLWWAKWAGCPWPWAWAWPCLCAVTCMWPFRGWWWWLVGITVWWWCASGRWATGILTGGLGGSGALPGDLWCLRSLGSVWNSLRGITGGGVGGCWSPAAGAWVCGPGWSRAAWVCCLRFWNVWALAVWALSAAWVRLLGFCWVEGYGAGAVPLWGAWPAPCVTGCVCVPTPCGAVWTGAVLFCWAMCACWRWLGSAKALVSAPCGAVSPCCMVGPCETAEWPTEAVGGSAWGLLLWVASCLGADWLRGEPLMSRWALSLCVWGLLCVRCEDSCWVKMPESTCWKSAEWCRERLSANDASCLGGVLLREAVCLWVRGWDLFVVLPSRMGAWLV